MQVFVLQAVHRDVFYMCFTKKISYFRKEHRIKLNKHINNTGSLQDCLLCLNESPLGVNKAVL